MRAEVVIPLDRPHGFHYYQYRIAQAQRGVANMPQSVENLRDTLAQIPGHVAPKSEERVDVTRGRLGRLMTRRSPT
jgi:hypothetical protein